ncbi:MAG: biopolymer transporter ExbD [Ignavibacteriales bacterium]|nr:biopolymer transporter ExbD [Ignavibacteriales bacterium]
MRRYKIDEKEFSEINITPFTDVVLVLLIIFMITSPFLITGSYKVKLPQSTNSETDMSKGVEVYLTENNEVLINSKVIQLQDVQWNVKNEFESLGTKDVIIKADKNVKHGSFIQLLDELKKAGAVKLLISTTRFETKSQ